MAQYLVSAKINSTIPASKLCYTLQIHHDDGLRRFDLLPITDVATLTEDYRTQQHKTLDLFFEDNRSIFIMSLMLYRKLANGCLILITPNPITTMCTFDANYSLNNEVEINFDYQEYQVKTLETQDCLFNTIQITVPRASSIFIAEHPLGGEYNPFSEKNVTKNIQDRLQGKISLFNSPVYPSIGDALHLSGASVFCYCVLKTRPDLYQQTIKELFKQGRVSLGSLDIQANDTTKKPPHYFYTERDFKRGEQLKLARYLYMPKVPPLDWICLSSLYDSLAQEKQEGMWPVVTESQIKGWFNALGSSSLISSMHPKKLTINDVCEAHQFIYRQHHILTLLDASVLTGSLAEQQLIWVVWADKLRLISGEPVSEKTALSEHVELVLYFQGEVKQYLKEKLTLNMFLQKVYGLVVFSKIS